MLLVVPRTVLVDGIEELEHALIGSMDAELIQHSVELVWPCAKHTPQHQHQHQRIQGTVTGIPRSNESVRFSCRRVAW